MPVNDLPPSLQESILAALVFDAKAGATIAAQVTPAHFDENYREIAERVLNYRRRYGKPPGRHHLDDLFGHSLTKGRAPRMRRLLFGLADLAEGLNGDYVVSQTQEFIRQQSFYAALIEANARWEQGGEGVTTDLERIFSTALKLRSQALDAGIFLNDTSRSLGFLERTDKEFYRLSIKELDRLGIGMVPKEMLLYIGPKESGKTWFCVHCGKEALLQQAKVCHISLEFAKELTVARYYQSLFGAATLPDKYDKTIMEFDDLGKLAGYRVRSVAPKWDFSSSRARRELARRIKPWGTRLGRLVVQDFPSGKLTVAQLEGYLDFLEVEHHFIPNVLIVDYPKLMKIDSRNYRIDLGQTGVDLRGVLKERNLAGVFPHQGNRSSFHARHVRSDMAGEDISLVQTADTVMAFSRTKAEEREGRGRLSVEHTRNSRKPPELLLTQSYSTGQYVLQSAPMTTAYWEQMGEAVDPDQD